MTSSHPWRGWDRHRVLIRSIDNVTGHLERDILLTALAAAEARFGERRGWDQPPRLWTLHIPDTYAAQTDLRVAPRRIWNPHGHPVDDLLAYASRLPEPSPPLPQTSFVDSPDGFCGMALMSEGYAVAPEHLTPSQMERARAGDRVALDHPDRLEIRSVTAVDINDYVYHVQRFRGHEPTRRVLDTDRGRVPWALGRISAHLRPA